MENSLASALGVVATVYVAVSTYRAGLRWFGICIAILGPLSFLVMNKVSPVVSWTLIVMNAALLFGSRYLIKKYRAGPFTDTTNTDT